MSIELELFTDLYQMFLDGDLAAEFDKSSNKMVNSQKVVKLMAAVKELLPEKLAPMEAAKAMRDISDGERDAAIKESGSKVVDMRKEFQRRMSANGGALGLTTKLVDAYARGDTAEAATILGNMEDLVKANEQENCKE